MVKTNTIKNKIFFTLGLLVCCLLLAGLSKGVPERSNIHAGKVPADLAQLSLSRLMGIEITLAEKIRQRVAHASESEFEITPAGSAFAATMEYDVKAAFIHNFTLFIDWPSEAFQTEDSPLRIGILGTGPIDEPLMNINGKKIQERVLEISRVQHLDEARGYHIIFVNPSEHERVPFILNTLKDTGILTIGDMPGFAEQCGVINFYLKNGKVRFEINIAASHREKLKISSKLLRLTRIVDSECD